MKYTYTLLIFAMFSCTPYKDVQQATSFNDIKYSYEVKKVEVDEDIEIAYIEEGSGNQTILFIHGLGSYLPAWKNNIRVLKDNYHCIAIDLPGYGKSSKLPYDYNMTFFADVIKKFIQKKGLSNVILAGHSMGGQISMITAIQNPDLINKIILVDPAGFERFNEGQKQWFRDVMTMNLVKYTSIDAIESNMAYNFYELPDDARFMIEDRIAMRTTKGFENYCYAIVKSVNGMINQPVIDKLNLITQPTLVFFGENDNLIPNRFLNPGKTINIAKSGSDKIKNSKLIMVPKSGHFMMFEQSEVFNTEVKKFLD